MFNLRKFALLEIKNILSTGVQVKREKLFDIWRSTSSANRSTRMIEFVQRKINETEITNVDLVGIKRIVRTESEKFRQKWNKAQRRYDRFIKAYNKWLHEKIDLGIITKGSAVTPGRPQKSFAEGSSKTKSRKLKTLITTYTSDELSYAAETSLRASGKRNKAKLIGKIVTSSPKRVHKYIKRLEQPPPEQRPYTPKEALALFISNKMTVNQYQNIQHEASERGFHLYPCYESVLEEKKKCYPSVDNIIVTDVSAEINLQALLNHTASRLCCDVIPEVFQRLDASQSTCTIVYKWGLDGSSGHSVYKQKFDDPEQTDEYMFVISLVPIRVLTEDGRIIWQNPRPSSPRLCRVIKFIYKKESEELIKEECRLMTSLIEHLIPTSMNVHSLLNMTWYYP